MYSILWRALPGPWWVRTLIVIFVLTVLLIACVMFIFPWVDHTFFAPADPLIGGGDGGGDVPASDDPTIDDGSVDDGDEVITLDDLSDEPVDRPEGGDLAG